MDLGRLTYSLAHDLRAPVRGINGLAHLIEADGSVPEPARELARRIIAGARGMSSLIESQVDLSRMALTPPADHEVPSPTSCAGSRASSGARSRSGACK